MKNFTLGLISALLVTLILPISSVPRYSFLQANNINTIFINNGVYNYYKFTFPGGDAGFVCPDYSVSTKKMVLVK